MRTSVLNFMSKQQQVHSEDRNMTTRNRDVIASGSIHTQAQEIIKRHDANIKEAGADEETTVGGASASALGTGAAVCIGVGLATSPIGAVLVAVGVILALIAAVIAIASAIDAAAKKKDAADLNQSAGYDKLSAATDDDIVHKSDDRMKSESESNSTWTKQYLDSMRQEYEANRGKSN
ncbi:MAG: hypothetical protein U1E65_11305 [Myxococcota bacterium]